MAADSGMSPEELMASALSITAAANAADLPVRLLGGVAIALHCPRTLGGGAHRTFGDIDAVTTRDAARRVAGALADLGFEPDARFNAMHGDRRLVFDGPSGKLDVFVGTFEMCHSIELDARLALEPSTLPATDLLITKLQIVELNEKDAADVDLLLTEHDLDNGPGDHIDVVRMQAAVQGDWGLWKTMRSTLESLTARADFASTDRTRRLITVLDQAPKSRAFRARARVGERKRWYSIPDEVVGRAEL